MTLELNALSDAIETHGKVVRVVIAEVKGSAPRQPGTAMLVWQDGQSGTIGGGALELAACAMAADMLHTGPDTQVRRQALGPDIGQCCGGAVTLVMERYDAARYQVMQDNWSYQGIWARRVEADAELPDKLHRHIRRHEHADTPMATTLSQGWLIEPVWRTRMPVFIYGAGHVGDALARLLAPMPAFDVWLVDVRAPLFGPLPAAVHYSDQTPPHEVMATTTDDAAHFIMTPEHDYDLTLCDTVLRRPFAFAGLIGSATKWARFRSRLAALGHSDAQISRIRCPIGQPELGKHPQAIAVGVASELLRLANAGGLRKNTGADLGKDVSVWAKNA